MAAILLDLNNPNDLQQVKDLLSPIIQAELKSIQVHQTELDEPVSCKQVAKVFGVTAETVSDWDKKGLIAGIRLGGRLYFMRTELMRALKEIQVKRKRK